MFGQPLISETWLIINYSSAAHFVKSELLRYLNRIREVFIPSGVLQAIGDASPALFLAYLV